MILAALILAELAAYVSYTAFITSPLTLFVPQELGVFLFALPFLGLIFKKPFSFYTFTVFVLFTISPALVGSESFYAVLDTAYYFGFRSQAEAVYSAFSGYKGGFEAIFGVTTLYILSEVLVGLSRRVEVLKAKGVCIENTFAMYAAAVLISTTLFLAYLYIFSPLQLGEVERLVSGLAGIAAFFIAAYLLSKSAEEEINSSG